MARKQIGINLDDNDMNNANSNFIELYADLGTATNTKEKLDKLLNEAGGVKKEMIADGSVTQTKIAANSLLPTHYKDGSIYTQKLANGAVDRSKIKDGEVTRSKIADGSVNSVKITNGSIYSNQIANRTIKDINIYENSEFLRDRKYITVIKNNDNMKIMIPGRNGKFICFEMEHWDIPFEAGKRYSNVDCWAIIEVGQYSMDEFGNFIKDENRVFVHSVGSPTSWETIFKLEGEVDYSGAFHHGDELLDFYKIFVGNKDITNINGTFEGDSLDMIQHTKLHEDTFTTNKMTEPYLKVKKHHRFDYENVYTLTQKVEFIKTVTPNFSSLGAFTLRRTTQDGTKNNFTDVLDLTEMRHVNIREVDTSHFQDDKVMKFKAMGTNKDVLITFTSDAPDFKAYLSNSNPVMAKIYSQVVPNGIPVEKGSIFSASANYKFITYED